MSQCSHYSYQQDKCDQEKSQFGDSCVSYDENLVNYDDEYSFLSVALEKTEIGCRERTLEDKVENTFSSATTLKPLKNDRKASPSYANTTKTTTKKYVGITKGSSSCNTKTSIDTNRGKGLKPKRIVKSIASQAPTSKKTESLTPLATNKFRSKNCLDSAVKEKRTTTNGFSFKTNERAAKKKEEDVEAIVRKDLNFKARPMPSKQPRPQHTSTGQAKARNYAQEHSSKASSDRSLANGTAKSKLNINKQKADTQRTLNGTRPNSSDQTARNNANRTSLRVRRSEVEVAL